MTKFPPPVERGPLFRHMSRCLYDVDIASLPFSRLVANTPAGDRKPQPFSQAAELKSTLALHLFWVQFISASNRGPSIVTEVEIQASDASARRAKPLLLSFAATTAG